MVSRALRRLVRVAIGGCGLAFASAGPAAAHPHVWINAVATFLFEEGMLVGMRHHWEFDEMFGSYVIEEQDADRNGRLDGAEIASIQANAFSNLRDYDYFTHVRIDGKDMPLHEVTDFTARIENGVLVYEFTIAAGRADRSGRKPVRGRRLRRRILCRGAAGRGRSGALRGAAERRLHLRDSRGQRAPDLLRHGQSPDHHSDVRDQLMSRGHPLILAIFAVVLWLDLNGAGANPSTGTGAKVSP